MSAPLDSIRLNCEGEIGPEPEPELKPEPALGLADEVRQEYRMVLNQNQAYIYLDVTHNGRLERVRQLVDITRIGSRRINGVTTEYLRVRCALGARLITKDVPASEVERIEWKLPL